VGLLVAPDQNYVGDFLSHIPRPDLVDIRTYSKHFDNWNPTQYKLDLVKFTDKYNVVVWLDSDVIVYHDLTNFLVNFQASKQNFALTKDHVMFDQDFKERWPGNKEKFFVAQACFMGFKAPAMASFFKRWEEIWRTWIEPAPFANFADPYPKYPASAFCIEQYALGMTISELIADLEADIYLIPRDELWIRDETSPVVLTLAGTSSSYIVGLAGRSSYPYASSYSGELISSYMSSGRSSYSTSYGLKETSSYGVGSSYSLYSSYPSSYASSYGSSYHLASSYASSGLREQMEKLSLSSSYNRSSYGISSGAFLTGEMSSGNFRTTTPVEGTPGFFVDTFAGGVLHYYSVNAERVKSL